MDLSSLVGFIFGIINIVATVILAAILAWKVIPQLKNPGASKLNLPLGTFILILCFLMSSVFYFVFDYVLTLQHPELYFIIPNVYFWKIGNFTLTFGFSFFIWVIDQAVLSKKYKGVFGYVIFGLGLVSLFYPVNSSSTYAAANQFITIGFLILLIFFIIFPLVTPKKESQRKYAFIILIAIIFYFCSTTFKSEFFIASIGEFSVIIADILYILCTISLSLTSLKFPRVDVGIVPETKISKIASPKSEKPAVKGPREQERIETLKKVIQVAVELPVARLAQILGMPEDEIWKRVIDWGLQFGFQIKGDTILFGAGQKDAFIGELERAFKEWESSSVKK